MSEDDDRVSGCVVDVGDPAATVTGSGADDEQADVFCQSLCSDTTGCSGVAGTMSVVIDGGTSAAAAAAAAAAALDSDGEASLLRQRVAELEEALRQQRERARRDRESSQRHTRRVSKDCETMTERFISLAETFSAEQQRWERDRSSHKTEMRQAFELWLSEADGYRRETAALRAEVAEAKTQLQHHQQREALMALWMCDLWQLRYNRPRRRVGTEVPRKWSKVKERGGMFCNGDALPPTRRKASPEQTKESWSRPWMTRSRIVLSI
jgi:hypothetical protein